MDLKDLTPNLDDIVVEIKHPSTGDVLKNDDGTNMTINTNKSASGLRKLRRVSLKMLTTQILRKLRWRF
jgi:hypothetical protein